MRFVLYDAKGDAIALADELSYIDQYMALERIRARSARYVAHEVIGDPAGLSIAPMTFIPFIETGPGKDSDCGELLQRVKSAGVKTKQEAVKSR